MGAVENISYVHGKVCYTSFINSLQRNNMTADEFLRLNEGSIPEVIQQYLQHQCDKIAELQEELQVSRKKQEILREQLYFGQDLVSNIDIFVSNNLSKRLQMEYGKIREGTYFET